MNYRMILHVLGRVLMICSLLLLLPLLVALVEHDPEIWVYGVVGCVLAVIGVLGTLVKPRNERIYIREGSFIVAFSWILLSAVGCLPFWLSSVPIRLLDSLFETVSGFTTTGASILRDVESLPKALLFWRSFTHWIGGMGVLVFVLAVLPRVNPHSVHIMRAEIPGPKVDKLVARVRFTVRLLYGIYIALTLLETLMLRIGGMSWFDSLLHSFATAGTGGFSTKNLSIAYFDSAYIQTVIGVFMLLFGVNFNLYYLILIGHITQALKSEELRWYLLVVVSAVALIALNITFMYNGWREALRYAFFQVSSILTTTGFSTVNFNVWPDFSRSLLVMLMFLGACAGSTGGGIKISRTIILIKNGSSEIRRVLFPNLVQTVKLDGKPVETNVIRGTNAYFIMYFIVFAVSFLILTFEGLDTESAFSAVAACLNNIGPGLRLVGPTSNYSGLTDVTKVVLIFNMIAGRLELIPIFALLLPKVWKS